MLKIAKETSELDSAIARLHLLKEQALAAQAAVEEQQAYVIDLMRLDQRKTYSTKGTYKYKATVVQGTTVKYDVAGLKKALGADLWKKVTVLQLDKKMLEDRVQMGEIDINVVAEHSKVTENKPYVRITPVEDAEEA